MLDQQLGIEYEQRPQCILRLELVGQRDSMARYDGNVMGVLVLVKSPYLVAPQTSIGVKPPQQKLAVA
jgi:hypothetical protein